MALIDRAKSPRHTRDGGIDLVIQLDSGVEVPFTARPDDPEEHGRELYARAVRGDFGEIEAPPAPPERTTQEAVREIEQRESGGNPLLANRAFRDLAIATLPPGHYLRQKSEQIEAAIAALEVRQ